MRRSDSKPAQEESAIDLTPMLDVVFIMLIFFIVTATFIKETGVEVARPDATTSTIRPLAKILIGIDANSEIWMDKEKIDVRAVRSKVESMRAENPEGTVVIQADEHAKADILIQVMDFAREAGALDIAISTEE